MNRMIRVGLLGVMLALVPWVSWAQVVNTTTTTDTIDANGDSVAITAGSVGAFGSVKVQTLDSYSGTWAVQCAADGSNYDATYVLKMNAANSSTAVTSVTDTVGIWDVQNPGACLAIKVIATAGFAASDTVVVISATNLAGGGGGGGGGASSTITDVQDGAGDSVGDDANDSLKVTIVSGAGSGGTALADDGDFTAATTNMTPAGGFYQSTPTACTDGDACAVGITANREVKVIAAANTGVDIGDVDVTSISAGDNDIGNVDLELAGTAVSAGNGASDTGTVRVTVASDSTGVLSVDDNAGALTVDNGGTFAVQVDAALPAGTNAIGKLSANTGVDIGDVDILSVIPGTGATNLGKAEDAAHTTADTVVPIAGVRSDTTPSSTAGTAGDYALPNLDANGRLYVNATIYDASGSATTVATDVTEDAAETAGGTGPMVLNVRRDTAASSAGTTGDNATFNTDALGLLWTRQLDPCSGVAKSYIPIDITTATTTELTPSVAGASTYYYVCAIHLVTTAANNVALVDDDTDGCGSVTAGLAGGLTADEGWNLAANGGLTLGNGAGSVMRAQTANSVLCLVTSASTQLSGQIVVAAAP